MYKNENLWCFSNNAGRLACYDTGGKFVAHREDVEQLLQDLRVPRREPVVVAAHYLGQIGCRFQRGT